MAMFWVFLVFLIGLFQPGMFQISGSPNQDSFGFNPSLGNLPNPQNMGIPNGYLPNGYLLGQSGMGIPYPILAQSFPMSQPYPGINNYYPYSGISYPFPYNGNQRMYFQQPASNQGPRQGQTDAGYSIGSNQQDFQYSQSTQQIGQNNLQPYDNIKTEILDVSPEYQRQLHGWTADSSPSSQGIYSSKPRYTVDVNTQTTNVTNVPSNLAKPIIKEKKFTTSIRKSFIYDSSKPENAAPVNIHLINGQLVTTAPPPTTTVNEDVQGDDSTSTFKPAGRRFMDVPKKCPRGTMLAQNGECIEPFFAFRNPPSNMTSTTERSVNETSINEI